jgi:hypothetical protein
MRYRSSCTHSFTPSLPHSCFVHQYARKWNKPVHEWLLRHVYLESLNTYKTSRMHATFITFFTSAIVRVPSVLQCNVKHFCPSV